MQPCLPQYFNQFVLYNQAQDQDQDQIQSIVGQGQIQSALGQVAATANNWMKCADYGLVPGMVVNTDFKVKTHYRDTRTENRRDLTTEQVSCFEPRKRSGHRGTKRA